MTFRMRSMRSLIRRASLGAVLIWGCFPGPQAKAAAEAGQLPYEWYVMPEDSGVRGQTPAVPHDRGPIINAMERRRGEQPLAETVDRVFGLTGDGLDKTWIYRGTDVRPATAPSDWAPWHPKELILSLGVSATGTFGVITGQGSVGMDVFFRPTKARLAQIGIVTASPATEESIQPAQPAQDTNPPAIGITSESTDENINRGLEPVIKTVMATRRIDDEGTLRSELQRVAKDLRDVMDNVNAENASVWHVSKLWLDISVSGSGMVQPGLSVGGGVRLRFQWTEVPTRSGLRHPSRASGNPERQQALRVLMAKIGHDLETVPESVWQTPQFKIGYIRVAIGGFVRGKFGIARVEGNVTGHAFFVKTKVRNARNTNPASREIANDPLPLFDGASKPEYIQYAKDHNVRMERLVPMERDAPETVVYFVDREQFRQGLTRSFSMAGFFAREAAKNTAKTWRIEEIRPQFCLSLMGVVPMVTIGGSVAIEAQYNRVDPAPARGDQQ